VRYTTPAGRLHVSLNTVWRANEEVQSALIDDALEAGGAIRRPGFDLAFDRVQTWPGNSRSKTGGRSIVPTVLLCSNGLREAQALFADIRREIHRRGMPASEKTFTPHMTLWWSHVRVPDFMLDRPCRWRVNKFWLVQTVRGRKQPEYVGEWTLGL
jgi:2'-5' RNA ligase